MLLLLSDTPSLHSCSPFAFSLVESEVLLTADSLPCIYKLYVNQVAIKNISSLVYTMQYYCSSCTDYKHTVLVYVDSRFSSCLILLLSVSSVLSWSSRCCCCCCCWAGEDPTLRREPTSREAELINTFSPLGSLCNPIICIINYVGCSYKLDHATDTYY